MALKSINSGSSQGLEQYLPAAGKAPELELESWLDLFTKYIRITYGKKLTTLITNSTSDTAAVKEEALDDLELCRDVLWMHLGKEGQRLMRTKYPHENISTATYSDLLTKVKATLQENFNEDMCRFHLQSMKNKRTRLPWIISGRFKHKQQSVAMIERKKDDISN